MITLQIEKPNKPEIVDLIAQLDTFLKSLYPPESNHLLDISTLMRENIIFLTAKEGERYVGCGALRLFKGQYAEIKRMYVVPAERGKQIGYRLLTELEKLASESGLEILRLETGIHQAEALHLYEHFGFRRIPPFGEYTDDPLSLCFEKQIVKKEAFLMEQHEDGMGAVIPRPVSAKATGGIFPLGPGANIYVEPGNDELQAIGRYLADKLKPSTGYALQVLPAKGAPQNGNILLTTLGGDPSLGEEGYTLTVTQDGVRLSASQPAGLFRGLQTIRQLLPPAIDRSSLQPGPWTIPTGIIRDTPRFAWRGTMLDVARHFFKVEDVKRYIDLAAYYKMNYFHLHLTDDQGWRIEIKSWPRLAETGGNTALGGGPGGYYTQEEYAEIVAYALSRYITVVPEIDVPGHVNAALVAYPELNCDDRILVPYIGNEVGFSSLCIQNDEIYTFFNDVIKELAALTPGPYIHIGGDEARATKVEEYVPFIERAQQIVLANGKRVIGWDEVAQAKLLPTTVVQRWNKDVSHKDLEQAAMVIMSPAANAYLDMKYTELTALGQNWAGFIEVEDAYQWDPATIMPGIPEERVLGVEAPLWSESLETIEDIEAMAFPRLPGYAEIGWSPQARRNWEEYKTRLAAQGPRLGALGVNFHPSPQVPWK